jgi:succinate dehydrogenase hydrophobic anchor subunit
MNQKMIRITALILAALIVGSVFIAAISSAAQ